jgi:hypothetical protein
MKKIILALAVLLLAAPAMAVVTITVDAGTDPNTAVIGFTSDEAELVRAIALDVQLSDANISIAEVNCVSDGYIIYPGSIDIDASGNVTDYGTCAGVLSGPDMTSEQGSLYVGAANAPAPGALFIITLAGCREGDDANVVVSVSENVLRGGVVMEDAGAPSGGVDVSDTALVETCLEGCACFGDVVGSTSPDPDFKVNTADLAALMGLLGPLGPPYDMGYVPAGWECMDLAGSTSPVPDDNLNTADLGALMGFLGPFGAPYDPGICMPAPPSGP